MRLFVKIFDWNTVSFEVEPDETIKNVMFQVIEYCQHKMQPQDWSGVALWCPAPRNEWLTRYKMTLEQYGLVHDSLVHLLNTHRHLRIQLPDQQVVTLNVDFSLNLFNLLKHVCKDLALRHAEELSFLRVNQQPQQQQNSKKKDDVNKKSTQGEEDLVDSSCEPKAYTDPLALSISPFFSVHEYLRNENIKYKSVFDKSVINSRWLDSSKSLAQQGIAEGDLVQLRFKYFAFYDLNAKYDAIRINQIYEQAKLAILSEEIECTEPELVSFAALQLQAHLLAKSVFDTKPQHSAKATTAADVDMALKNLEKTLTISSSATTTTTTDDDCCSLLNADLAEDLFLMKPQKYTFRKFKPYFFVLNDIHYLTYYKTRQDAHGGRPVDKLNLKGCELEPDLARKYSIVLKLPRLDGMSELVLRCPNEYSYAHWMAAFKLASKSKPISDPAYQIEVNSILNLFKVQQQQDVLPESIAEPKAKSLSPASSSAADCDSGVAMVEGNNEELIKSLLPPKMLKKHKLKQLNNRIMEAYSAISDLDLVEAKLRYIKSWQALPDYGITYFSIRVKGSRFKEEILGITCSRIMRLNPSGELAKQWRFNAMKLWDVNWDTNQFEIVFDDEKLSFVCLSCDAKILNEFIGGYIFLSLRSSASKCDDETFFKLTDKR